MPRLWIVVAVICTSACGQDAAKTSVTSASVPAVANAQTTTAPSTASIEAHVESEAVPAGHHCEGSPALCSQNAAPPSPQATATGALYGASFDENIVITPLSELLASPALFANKTVRTSGTIGRVCQHRGCWMELRADQDDAVVRVPMAGHAFFVPSDSSGRAATIQGSLSVSEGRDNPVRIDATSVLIATNAP